MHPKYRQEISQKPRQERLEIVADLLEQGMLSMSEVETMEAWLDEYSSTLPDPIHNAAILGKSIIRERAEKWIRGARNLLSNEDLLHILPSRMRQY